MNWPQSIVDAIVAHILDTADSKAAWIFQDLEKQIKAELEHKADEWRQAQELIGPLAYREKYGLSEQEADTACRLKFLKMIARDRIPSPFYGFVRNVYPDTPLTPEQLRQVREESYLSTGKAAAYLGISTSAFRKLGIAPTVPPWNQHGQYSGNFYQLSDLIQHKGAAK